MNYLQAVRHPKIAAMGYREGSGDMGMTFDDDPESPRSVAYDLGRNVHEWAYRQVQRWLKRHGYKYDDRIDREWA